MASSPFSESGRGGRPSLPRQPLGTVIFQKGLLSAEQLLEALEEGHRSRRRLGDVLLERGWLDERALAETLAEQYGLPFVDLAPDAVDEQVARQISAHDSQRLGAIVIGVEDGAPVVALSDPSDAAALAELERMLPGALFAVAAASRVAEALTSLFSPDGERGQFLPSADAPVTERSAARDQFVADEDAESEPTAPVAAHAPEPLEAGEVFDDSQEAEAAAGDLNSAFAAPAESLPFEPGAHDAPASPAAVATHDGAAVPEGGGDAPAEPPKSQDEPAHDLSFAVAAPAESVPSEPGAHDAPAWPAAVATHYGAAVPEERGDASDKPFEFREADEAADDLSSASAPRAESAPSELGAHDAPAWPAAMAMHGSAAVPEERGDASDKPLEFREADEAADDLSSASAPPAESAPSELGAHDPAARPAPVATQDHVAMPEQDGNALPAPHEAEVAEEAPDDLSWAFAAPAESVPAELGSYAVSAWPPASAAREDIMASEREHLNGHAGNGPAASLVVLRLADGSAVELGSFADRASASSRAAELIEQLIADQSKGWTEIEGSYFRLQPIIAVDVVPAAG